MEPGCIGRLLEEGWQKFTFFDEIQELLPGILDGWNEEGYKLLCRLDNEEGAAFWFLSLFPQLLFADDGSWGLLRSVFV